MGRLDPAVAAGRLAVRACLPRAQRSSAQPTNAGAPGEPPLALVACSGGTDSLALAAVTAFEAPRRGWRAGAVIVDHGLLPGSAAVAATAREQCRALGLAPVEVVAVAVDQTAAEGVEAAARAARYAALDDAANRHRAAVTFLGHTLNDQAETVLLALARGSGARALAGMAPRRGPLARPFLDLTRAQTEAIIRAEGLTAWQDPTNQPGGPHASRRSQVRAELMPVARAVLGPGFERALAKTAAQLLQDADHLDAQAGRLLAQAVSETAPAASGKVDGEPETRLRLDVEALAAAPPALRARALHQGALRAGARAGDLGAAQIEALDRLVTRWRGQGPVALAGQIAATRKCGKLEFRAMPIPITPPRRSTWTP
ncbi:MAG: tRNA lysidine(34) synthetase TilS [Bifidobacteriaceae bacterium]|jgi:tRNA(Ile)-lysidine synthase|nr:tRNA lysidine(34) synthetase TilS [Bifidobacteriaceae bacterium]